ncbi:IS605/IS200 family transposase [Liquorilactobacillus mali KCTC 3596 = DSM 20444]|uniref:Uncharacterized protein n=1 Tax=Liquorilactobacillus mali KCTC 3596 = DSM 20444 TaxID=1046596 RepID=J0URW9_9LACO|nr:IS605/IS200 family transposase [Liquorilactobacillus mali KCTC 3596 = DSM 20444]KRN09333.1 hypothetical protein FD00_GL001159 [Liquorilactobacillus mali KCTC 3596 = DSM 20444]
MEIGIFGQEDTPQVQLDNQKTLEKYIRKQVSENRLRDTISKREYINPFKQKNN